MTRPIAETARETAHRFCGGFECDSGDRHSKNCDWLTSMIAEALQSAVAAETERCSDLIMDRANKLATDRVPTISERQDILLMTDLAATLTGQDHDG